MEIQVQPIPKRGKRNLFVDMRKFLQDIGIKAIDGAIRSYNFISGSQGWEILANGDINTNGTITARRLTLENFKNDDDSSIVYTGTWVQQSAGTLLGGTRMESSTINDFFVISFTGSSIGIFFEKGGNVGKLDIYIDDVFQETVDLFSASLFIRSIVYSTKTLTTGAHTLKGIIVTKNVSSLGQGVALQGYTLFPHDGIKMEQLSADVYVYGLTMLTDANGYKKTSISTPTGYASYHIISVKLSDAVMEDATLNDPITAWRVTEIYLYNGAASTSYTVSVTLLISKL